MTKIISHYIQGQVVDAAAARKLDIFNPASGEVIAQVAMATQQEVAAAIASAKMAFNKWSIIPPARRVEVLYQYHQLLHQHLDELAEIISREHGKTLADARGSVQRGIEVVEFACGAPHFLKGEYSAQVGTGVDTYSLRCPLGVCVGITPFNFPAMIGLWMFSIAIACGNTFILKPSEKDPSCSIRLAELLTQAGLPDGVLNIIQGDKEAVDILITHPDVTAVSFVGSTSIAKHVYQTAAAHGKRVQCGGGAKNHAIILADADLEQVAHDIVGAAYGSAGERCMAISVAVPVGNQVADQLIKKIKPLVEKIKIGPGSVKDTEMGPLVTQEHFQRVKSYVDLGVAEGAELVVDGRDYQNSLNGFYLAGCLFDKVQPTMRIYQEEIFGPVLSVMRAPDVETAIQWVNENNYGNGTAIFTQSGYAAHEFAMRVQVGMVGINVPIPVPVGYHTFAGWKNSFFGDTGMYGTEGVHFYTKIKTITQRWIINKQIADFNIPTSK